MANARGIVALLTDYGLQDPYAGLLKGALLCVNPLVPFDASSVTHDGRLAAETVDEGGLPRVLAQTFRAIIHSRMRVGMEKYRRQYPHADILLFEPDREDPDMFRANIFSYAQRERICEAAYRKTRRRLFEQRAALQPMLARHGIRARSPRVLARGQAPLAAWSANATQAAVDRAPGAPYTAAVAQPGSS